MRASALKEDDQRVESSHVEEIDILWLTAGLGCDGESIAMTAAAQPSIEDLVPGGIPGIPRIKLHNPVCAYENGDEFLKDFYLGAAGKARSIYPDH